MGTVLDGFEKESEKVAKAKVKDRSKVFSKHRHLPSLDSIDDYVIRFPTLMDVSFGGSDPSAFLDALDTMYSEPSLINPDDLVDTLRDKVSDALEDVTLRAPFAIINPDMIESIQQQFPVDDDVMEPFEDLVYMTRIIPVTGGNTGVRECLEKDRNNCEVEYRG